MGSQEQLPIRVFISYTHESTEHDDRVENLSEALRKNRIDCRIDKQVMGSPPEGWPRWCSTQVQESQFVLVVCTEIYKRRFGGKEEAGKGLGANWESLIITQELYDAGGNNTKFIPVVFSPEDAQHIPVELRGQTHYDLSTPEDYVKLSRRLTNQPARMESPVVPQIRRMVPLEGHRRITKIMVNVFDGSREPISNKVQLLVRLIDGSQYQAFSGFCFGPSIAITEIPFFDNFRDSYTVLVSADKYVQAGFTPVKMVENTWQHVDLMLLPKDGGFNFASAEWDTLLSTHPQLFALLSQGVASDAAARERYDDLRESRPATLAAFFNITTAMADIKLPVGSPLDYFKALAWDEMQQDRFFAYADSSLVEQVQRAAAQKTFVPEFGSGFFHPGATQSYKQVQFGEANVQLTFYEGDTQVIGGVKCVKVEPDIDYYRDIGAHGLLEVLPNEISGRLTDPKQVYVLRWIAGRQADILQFNPPYTIV